MALLWGGKPVLMPKEEKTGELFETAKYLAKKQQLIHNGDTIVLTAGIPLGISGRTNMIHVMEA